MISQYFTQRGILSLFLSTLQRQNAIERLNEARHNVAIGAAAAVALAATASSIFNSQGNQDGQAALPMPEFPTGFPLWDQYNNPATELPVSQQFRHVVPSQQCSAANRLT
jgi:hypothetical protein